MQPDLDNIKKKVEESRDLIDKISVKIPGFSSMVEQAESYAADQVVRDFMADKVQSIKGELSEVAGRFSREKIYDLMTDIDSLSINFEKLYKMTKFADYASSASASGLKVTEKDKERLLEFDWRLIASLDEFDDVMGRLKGASKEDAPAVLNEIRNKISEFEKSFNERKNTIMEVL